MEIELNSGWQVAQLADGAIHDSTLPPLPAEGWLDAEVPAPSNTI